MAADLRYTGGYLLNVVAQSAVVAALNRYEQGQSLPRTESLRRILEAMGATMHKAAVRLA